MNELKHWKQFEDLELIWSRDNGEPNFYLFFLGNMTMRKLLLTGNPLRTLRRFESLCWPLACQMCLLIKGLSNWNFFSCSSLVSGPTAALLKYLRSRLSEGEGMLVLAKHASVWWSLIYQVIFFGPYKSSRFFNATPNFHDLQFWVIFCCE